MLALLLACETGTVVVDNTEEAKDDTATADDDASDDTAGDSAEEVPAEPVTDYSAYTGYRHFYAEVWGYACDTTVEETGTELTEGDAYEALAAECPSCTNFYENVPLDNTICDDTYPIEIGTTYRAMLYTESGGVATFYNYDADGGSVSILGADNGLEFDGETTVFDYTFEYLVTFYVDGEMYFEMTTPE
ncbi:MAG: hypothetical protein FJ090_07785 [Deltaproteobacteria bacterium]|nr:hypothetical protein [Deltaproteobacteria bacterium]